MIDVVAASFTIAVVAAAIMLAVDLVVAASRGRPTSPRHASVAVILVLVITVRVCIRLSEGNL